MLSTKGPLVTVLMPMYNGEQYLYEAIESILNQTYRHFELLIINDGSTDRSVSIVESFDDPRIRLAHNETNLGIVATLNKGIAMARGKYIARMDCDDISFPNRLERQTTFLERNPDTGICAGNIQIIQGGRGVHLEAAAFDPYEVQFRLLFYCCLAHPTVMMRKDSMDQYNLGYRPVGAEDYDLWVQAVKKVKIHKLAETVLYYRDHGGQLTKTNADGIQSSNDLVIMQQLETLGAQPSERAIRLHQLIGAKIASSRFRRSLLPHDQVKEAMEWLAFLNERNNHAKVYNKDAFNSFIGRLHSELTDFLEKINEIKERSHKKIYLFGCGRIGETYLNYLRHEGIQVMGFLDNSPTRWGEYINGVPVLNPSILGEEITPFLVIVTSIHAEEIMAQLENMGLSSHDEFMEPFY